MNRTAVLWQKPHQKGSLESALWVALFFISLRFPVLSEALCWAEHTLIQSNIAFSHLSISGPCAHRLPGKDRYFPEVLVQQ